jgi:hypothetical protein
MSHAPDSANMSPDLRGALKEESYCPAMIPPTTLDVQDENQ